MLYISVIGSFSDIEWLEIKNFVSIIPLSRLALVKIHIDIKLVVFHVL